VIEIKSLLVKHIHLKFRFEQVLILVVLVKLGLIAVASVLAFAVDKSRITSLYISDQCIRDVTCSHNWPSTYVVSVQCCPNILKMLVFTLVLVIFN
jgi:hypothetical protein